MERPGSSIRPRWRWLPSAVWVLSVVFWIATRWRARGEWWDWTLSALAWGPVALSIGGALLYVLFILGYSIGNALRRRLWMGAVLLCVAGYGGWKLGVGVPIYWVWQAVLIIGCIALLAGMFGEPLGP